MVLDAKKEYKIITVRPNSLRSEHAVPLAITEQRILFYSIFKIQSDKNTVTFTKQEINDIFRVDFGSFRDIEKYLTKLRTFGMDMIDEKNNKMRFINAFTELIYDNGLFTFSFNKSYLPTLETQKSRFLRYGFKNLENFKSKYTIYLYDYLKDVMWGNISKKENIPYVSFRNIFKLDSKQYAKNNNNFKTRVWGPAMEEINMYTDYKIDITVKGQGQLSLFTIIRYENEDFKQKKNFACHLGKIILDDTCEMCNKINICNVDLDSSPFTAKYSMYNAKNGHLLYIEDVLYRNKQYCVHQRVLNQVASNYEKAYFNWRLQLGMDSLKAAAEADGREFNEKEFNIAEYFTNLKKQIENEHKEQLSEKDDSPEGEYVTTVF